MKPFSSEAELEDALSRPSAADVDAVKSLEGDIMVLGAGGKMGPTLVRRAARAVKEAAKRTRVYAVARRAGQYGEGVDSIGADLLDRAQISSLPDAPNVIYLVGRKFGSTGNEPLTWATNAIVPVWVAERFAASRIVALSTGNVYPFVPVASGGATEQTPTAPVGEYAQSALARERIFQYFSDTRGTRIALLRLNYAIEMRYGVLVDIATKVLDRTPIDLAMGYANVIWQGDANSVCLRALSVADSPARVLNLTGPELMSVRSIAEQFGSLFGVDPVFTGAEADTALLSNASECHRIFGPPAVKAVELMPAIAEWLRAGNRLLGKPTHFETRSGRF